MIPAEKMIVLWDCDDRTSQVKQLIVIRQDQQNRKTDKLPASAGCCDDGWLERGFINTPQGLYAHIATAYGFPSRDAALAALREFDKVEGQAWVHELREAAGDPTLQDDPA